MQRLSSLERIKAFASSWLVCCVLVSVCVCAGTQAFSDPEPINAQTVRVRVSEGQPQLTLSTVQNFVVEYAADTHTLPPGTYTLGVQKVQPAKERFHVFTRTFKPDERDEEKAYMRDMRRRGFRPKIVTIGKRFATDSDVVLETRVRWVSIERFDVRADADAMRLNLEAREDESWIQREIDKPGRGQLTVSANQLSVLDAIPLPATIRSASPITLQAAGQPPRKLAGDLELSVGQDGTLEVIETLPVERYLAGVLPAEMPPLWPIEALKAQAVAARSEVLASMAAKHSLEGYDFCSEVHCRAYLGSGDPHDTTSRAIRETAGEILVQGVRIVPTVFSSNCGGWTEDNDAVWYGPPNPALRGVADGLKVVGVAPSPQRDLRAWLNEPGPAFCAQDKAYFRWTRVYSLEELSALVNKLHPVGQLEKIELGARGVSGRLKWVRIIGAEGTATVHKELGIRRAFGGLPSALFVLDTHAPELAPPGFTFTGAGRGHGVGLCQHGARGMAERGMLYSEVLNHYFREADVLRYR